MGATTRYTFRTSRLAEFTSEKGLVALTGLGPDDWPVVIIKELADDAGDACEDAEIAPRISLAIEDHAIVVEDNGPGIDPDVVRSICDYSQNTSCNAAYIGPTRGQQGNALQTIFAMPYIASDSADAVGETIIESKGELHRIAFTADPITRVPRIEYEATKSKMVVGTRVTVNWPHSLADDRAGLFSYALRLLWFNPHLTLTIEGVDYEPQKPDWRKWKPSATNAHWYGLDQFKRLLGVRVSNDPEATVRDFVRMFDGLTAKDRASAIIGAVKAERETLDDFTRSSDKRIPTLAREPDQMTTTPTGAPPGYYYNAATNSYVECPAGTYSPGGATTPTADPGGYYSAAGAGAPTEDPAGTYSSPYALDRLFIGWQNNTPDNAILSFHNVTEVANYYGVASDEAAEAREFFTTYGDAATMEFTRFGYKQRPHLLGANINQLGILGLQAIHGVLDVTFNGWQYAANVNLAGVTSFAAAAALLGTELDSRLPVAATTTDSSISAHSVGFTGRVSRAYLAVTAAAPGSIQIGGIISGNGVVAGTQIIEQLSGTPGGVGEYATFTYGGQTADEAFTESYGVLTAGPAISGAVALGERVNGLGLLPHTAIDGYLGGNEWLLNNAQTVAAENMTMSATPLAVGLNWAGLPIIGATENNNFLDLTTDGGFGWNNNPSSISFASSPVGDQTATRLGLTQAAGAIDASPGGQDISVYDFMNRTLAEGAHFGSFQTNLYVPPVQTDMEAWAVSSTGGRDAYTFLSNLYDTLPAGSSLPTTDPPGTYSLAGATAPTLDPPGTFSLPGHS